MKSSILSINNLGKAYRKHSHEWRRILSWFGFSSTIVEQQWILQDINFSITSGEAIGIVGQNGAGKSTLLKLITGTLKPTVGTISLKGRIAAILELGMGFNADFTGRQNAYHASGLMGYTKEQIDAVINSLEEFAEIGDYFDKPVRMYSSGMQMRVAFAVATAYRPDILIVDEALSVGDAYFQHKSFARIKEYKEQGTTLLLVSHDESAIQSVCNRAILLEKGKIIQDGNPEEVLDYYKALIAQKEHNTIKFNKLPNGKMQTLSGTGEAKITFLQLYDEMGSKADVFKVGGKIELRIMVQVNECLDSLVLGFSIKDRLGQIIYGTNTWYTQQVIRNTQIGDIYQFSVLCNTNLGVGDYSIQVALHDTETHLGRNYEWIDMATMFSVINEKDYFIGLAWVQPQIRIKHIEDNN